MPTLTFKELAEMTGGKVVQNPDAKIRSVVIDSREVKPDSVFFAIKGDRLDGHQFLPQALETARGAIVHKSVDVPSDKGVVSVKDTTVALQDLARAIRKRFPFLMIAITGSAGKTTTKEMIATLVATERKTWRSLGNFNNHIGFPLSMANTPDGTEVVVSEMGMSAKGEIDFLAKMVRPDVGVYTTIQPVHLEFFGSIDGIAAAKRELLENVPDTGTLILNADDPRVMKISREHRGRKITYGIQESADFRAENVMENGLLGSRFRLVAEGSTREISLPLPGRHNLENLLAAIATARAVGISWPAIERGIAQLQPAYHRGVAVPYRGAILYDDTYNSNPYALGRALDLLSTAEARGRRIAVVGDMLELGSDELKFHYDTGRAIPKNIDAVVGVGKRARSFLDGARDAGVKSDSIKHFDDALAAGDFLRSFIKSGDLVLLKASRGIGLDRIVTALTKDSPDTHAASGAEHPAERKP